MTFAWRCTLVAVLLSGAWTGRVRLGAPQPAPDARALSAFPSTIESWRSIDSPLAADVLKVAAVDDYLNRSYRSAEGVLGLYVGYYRSQREGEALHSPLNCLPGAGWAPIRTESIEVTARANFGPHTVNKLIVQKGIDRMLVLYWYQTVHRVTASEYWRKIFLVRDAFDSGRTDVALVRIIAPFNGRDAAGEASALRVAQPFAARVLPEVQKQLFQ